MIEKQNYEIRSNKGVAKLIKILIILCVIIWTSLTLLPFVFMVLNSFKDQFDLLTNGAFALPEMIKIENYTEVLSGNFFIYFKNSVIVLTVSLMLLLFVALCASYPLSRFKLPCGKYILAVIVACMSIPMHVTLIPIFKMSQEIGLYDNIIALVGPYMAMPMAISVFILTGFMKEIPIELEEAAKIDGASIYKVFFTMILPLSKPGIVTLIIYNGVAMWNEFVFAYTLTQKLENRTLPLAVWDYQGEHIFNTTLILAVLVLTLLPMLILFGFTKEHLIKGMTAGAVKG